MSRAYSPLRYPGGKNCIFSFVSDILRANGLLGCYYAEPYAGGAGLALRLLFEEYAQKVFINDLDPLIYAFWSSILDMPEDFCDWIDNTPVSVTTWKKCKSIIQNPIGYTCFEVGTATFFLNRTNVSGIIDGGIIGGLEQHGKYKIDARFNKVELAGRIRKIARHRDRIVLSNLDGIAFTRRLNKRKDNIFIYLDPPYFEKGSRLYMNAYKAKDHATLSKNIFKIEKPWMISYDNNEFILKLYPRCDKYAYKLSHATSNKIGDEVVIFPSHVRAAQSTHLLDRATRIA